MFTKYLTKGFSNRTLLKRNFGAYNTFNGNPIYSLTIAKVYYKNNTAKLVLPVPPTYEKNIILVHPAMSFADIADLLKATNDELAITFKDADTHEYTTFYSKNRDMSTDTLVLDFLQAKKPQKLQIELNNFKRVVLQNAAYTPVNKFIEGMD